jgi:hypothetical protein
LSRAKAAAKADLYCDTRPARSGAPGLPGARPAKPGVAPEEFSNGASGENHSATDTGGAGTKYRAVLATVYGAGPRVSEVVLFKAVDDVDSESMLLRAERGKGRKSKGSPARPNHSRQRSSEKAKYDPGLECIPVS